MDADTGGKQSPVEEKKEIERHEECSEENSANDVVQTAACSEGGVTTEENNLRNMKPLQSIHKAHRREDWA